MMEEREYRSVRSITPQELIEIVRMYKDGKGSTTIGCKMGLRDSVVVRLLRSAGVEIRGTHPPFPPELRPVVKRLARKGMTAEQIKAYKGWTWSTKTICKVIQQETQESTSSKQKEVIPHEVIAEVKRFYLFGDTVNETAATINVDQKTVRKVYGMLRAQGLEQPKFDD